MSSSANEMFDDHLGEQAQFLLVEETRLARAQRDQPGQAPVDPQRQQRERIVAFAGERRAVGGARVAGDIVGDHRLRRSAARCANRPSALAGSRL